MSPKHFVIFTLSATASLASAATPAIGVAMSQGNISIDSASTAGNATLFQGSTLQTGKMASQIRLKDGAFLRLESGSRAQIFSDHANLQEGSARVSGYSANANGPLLDFDYREVQAAQAIIANARSVVLVADSTKLRRTAPVRLAHISQIQTFVTDVALPARLANICQTRGIEVIEAMPKPPADMDEPAVDVPSTVTRLR